jgi:hypothetical protein
LSGKFTVLVKPRFLILTMVTDFQENIDEEKLFTFEQKLSRWQNEIGVTDQAIIDSLLEDPKNNFRSSGLVIQ